MVIGRRSRSSACWVGLLAAVLTASATVAGFAQQAPTHRPVRASKAPETEAPAAAETTRTRFIIGVERPVDFKISALSNPNRVLIDLPQVKLELPSPPGNTPVGVVKS